VHDTDVVPSGKVEPEAGVQLRLVTPTLSVAVTAYVTTAPEADVASVVIADGTVMVGGVESVTVTVFDTDTVIEDVPTLPAASYAFDIRV
jgi:hypothetical protein